MSRVGDLFGRRRGFDPEIFDDQCRILGIGPDDREAILQIFSFNEMGGIHTQPESDSCEPLTEQDACRYADDLLQSLPIPMNAVGSTYEMVTAVTCERDRDLDQNGWFGFVFRMNGKMCCVSVNVLPTPVFFIDGSLLALPDAVQLLERLLEY